MNLTLLLSFVSAFLLAVVRGQSSATLNATAASAGIDISKIPACFSTCAGQVAASKEIGCGSLLNFTCICSSPTFSTEVSQCIASTTTNDCPTQSKNATALAENNEIFASICKAVSGNSSASHTGSASTNATTHTSGENMAMTLTPAVTHVFVTAITILSVLLFGAVAVL